jgi:hypothetical protein
MYQAGYLTISDYDKDDDVFKLAVPNSEVRVGLLNNLLPLYATDTRTVTDWKAV